MKNNDKLNPRPHLVAAWPGMGNVAVMAAGYLVRKLEMEPLGEISLEDYFDLNHVTIANGVVQRPRLPRGLLFRTPASHAGQPLIVFLSEAQPTRAGYAFVHKLLDHLAEENIDRVFTFASLASQIHPAEETPVTAAVTSRDLLLEAEALGLSPASDGSIGGLNGLLLGAAAERELHGLCLLVQIPAFAARMPNPKSARAALASFADLAEVDLDFEELGRHVETAERAMIRMLERIQRAQAGQAGLGEESEADGFDLEEFATPEPETLADTHQDGRPGDHAPLEPEIEARIEQLFQDAEADRRVAFELKSELDKHGVFAAYEDRFLDLFRQAG